MHRDLVRSVLAEAHLDSPSGAVSDVSVSVREAFSLCFQRDLRCCLLSAPEDARRFRSRPDADVNSALVADGREAEDVDPRGSEVHIVEGSAPDPDGLDKLQIRVLGAEVGASLLVTRFWAPAAFAVPNP